MACSAQPANENLSITPEQWREDLRYFAREMPKQHKNLYHTVSREEFERDIAALDAAIPSLQPHEIVVRLQRITAKVGDGHTGVHLPLSFGTYPLGVYWFGKDLRVTRTTNEYVDALGTRVVKIGSLGIDEVRERLSSVMSRGESEWHFMNNSLGFITRPEVLHALGIVPSLDHAEFTFAPDDGEPFSLELPAAPAGSLKNTPMRAAAEAEPLSRQKTGEPFWFTYLPESKTVYVNFRKYDDLAGHARELFDFIDSKSTERLVIDLRQNDGGDFIKGRVNLIVNIKKRPELNQKGKLFVIVGRRTYSAAMVNAVDFRKDTNAILVGEPIGAKPNSYSENDELVLPNSKITVSYSTRYYKFVDEDVPVVMPDKRFDPAWEDFKAGRDPALDWVLAYTPGTPLD